MKNHPPCHPNSLVTYFLSFLFLCLVLSAHAQLPPGWSGANVGASTGGGETWSSGTFAIVGKGTGLSYWLGGVDNMHFTYQQVTGDVEIVARLVSFDNTDKGNVGLAIRAGTGASDQAGDCFFYPNWNNTSKNYFFHSTRAPAVDGNPDYYYMQGGGALPHPIAPPFWFKLVRVGNNFGSYWSLDGRDWFLLHNSSGGVFFPTGTYDVGFCVSSNSTTVSSTATFDNVYVGPPRLKYKTSWVGATSGSIADGNPSNQIYSLWVKPSDGTCYAGSNWDETGGLSNKLYKDGKVFHAFDNRIIGNTGSFEGGVTGNATHIFFYDKVSNVPKVYRTDFTTNCYPASPAELIFSTPALGVVGGLAASATRIFVSDVTNNLVRIVDAATLTEITPAISFPNCGPIAYDGTNFWITQAATHDPLIPLSFYVTGTYSPAIKCYSPTGADLSAIHAAITDVAIPTALAYDDRGTPGTTSDDRLWICDNGPNQNVRYYTNLTGNPTFAGTFGQTGGIWAGSHPGQIVDAAAGGDQRFYGPVGIGVDTGGNIYVACNGGSHFVTDLRKFNSAGILQWRQNGLVFCHLGDFDPASDGQQIYSPEKHFTMNYANTAPGSEWSYTGFTRNLTLNANEGRNPVAPAKASISGAKLARLGASQFLYMYTTGQGLVGTSWLYYFNGETAMPYGSYALDSTAPFNHRLWIDANLNGVHDAGEDTTAPLNSTMGGPWQAFDVDSQGDIWMAFMGTYNLGYPGGIRRIVCSGTQTLPSGPVVPNYSLNAPGGYIDYTAPLPLRTVANVNYDRTNDVLYVIGQKFDGTWMLVRCDKWLANPENKYAPVVTWAIPLPPSTDQTILFPGGANFTYFGLDVAGGKIFVGEQYGPVHVYDAALGNPEIILVPGPENSARVGWIDMSMGVNAFKRSTGEYLITIEDAGIGSNNLLYRWTPTADTAIDAAPTTLTATAPGRKVVLSWIGSPGMVIGYNLYRGTSSGTETLYQGGLTSPYYTDTNVTPGTTYYYKVTAINAAGESAQSNEANATPLSTQVEFVRTDATTQGTWKGVYGVDGYEICNNATNYPAYASVSATGTVTASWVDPTSDVRALQKAATGSTDRIAAYRAPTGLTGATWSWTVNLTDGKWHQVAIYMLDWNANRPYCQVDVLDATTNAVLYSRAMNTFTQGQYLIWNITGNVKIQISNIYPSAVTAVCGLFFDPIPTPTPALGWWKLNETSGALAADSSGLGQTMTQSSSAWDAAGEINGCLNMSGVSCYLGQPVNTFRTANVDRTYATWFRTSTAGPIVGSQNTPQPSPPTQYAPILYVGDDGKLYGSYMNNTSIAPMVSTTTVNDNNWHHVALVRTGAFQALYLDGNVVGNLAGTIPLGWTYAWMGMSYTSGWPHITGSPAYFTGRLDDVRIYDRAVGPGEIWKLAHP